MAAQFNLGPNESIILKEVNVAHGGVMAIYTDELILTNINVVYINKGMFGNTKGIFMFPLNQLKRYNGKPQAIMGKLSNGIPALELYFMNGIEQFNFHMNNKGTINKWISEINKVLGVNSDDMETSAECNDDSDTLVGAFREVGNQFKEVGTQFKEAFGFSTPLKNKRTEGGTIAETKINKKCISCSAPLIGYKGKVVHCKYCDTDQTL